MKHIISLAVAYLVGIGASAQIKESALSVSVVTRENIEKSGKVEINLSALIPTGKGAENYSTGISLGAKYLFLDASPTVFTSEIPVNETEQIEVLKDAKGPVISSNSISSVLHLIENKSTTDDLYLSYIEESRWNLSAGLGYDLMFGKTVDYGFGDYTYDALNLVYGYIGYDYRPCGRSDLELNAGPGMAIFTNGTEFGYRFGLNGSFDLTKPECYYSRFWDTKKFRCNTAVTLGMSYNKFNEVDGFTNIYGGITMRF